MRGVKAVNLISRIVRIVGIVLILTALVLFLYAAINTGSHWGNLKQDMDSFGVQTSLADRARFDDQLFSAMSIVTREDTGNAQSDAEAAALLARLKEDASPYFSGYYDRARKGLSDFYREQCEEVYRWFETEFDAAGFVAENGNIDLILQSHEISEILDFLKNLYTPKKAALARPDQRGYFETLYQEYTAECSEKGLEAGTWFEFLSVIREMVTAEQNGGAKINMEARTWYANARKDEGFDARYQEALAAVREQEARDGGDNYIVQLVDAANRSLKGETVDYRALLDQTAADLSVRFPETAAQDQHIYLLTIKELTESLLPEKAELTEGDGSQEASGPAEEASTLQDEVSEEEEEAREVVLDPNRFDGSFIQIRNAMMSRQEEENKYSPETRKDLFIETVVKDARNRSSIGMLVTYFWAVTAKYLLILAIGVLLVLLAAIVQKIMRHYLLTRKTDVDELKQRALEEQANAPEQPEAFDEDVLLRVSHLKQYFRSGNYVNKAVDDISFYVKKGEVLGLVGESGCGKTTTGRTIINLYDPTEGDVYFEGLRVSSNLNGLPVLKRSLRSDTRNAISAEKDRVKKAIAAEPGRAAELRKESQERIRQLKADLKTRLSAAGTNALISFVEQGRAVRLYREHRKQQLTEQFEKESAALSGEALAQAEKQYQANLKIAGKDNIMSKMQMIFQDPIASINPRMTVREIIAEGLLIQGVKDKEYINEKVYEMLELVGLVREHADRYPHEFSGGQRQRIGIARAIIMNPDLIIADEPISALDVSIQAQVINLLNDLRNRMGLTIMFIAHNLSVVKYFSDRIAVMYYGKIVEMTTSDELFAHPLHPYTKSLLSAIPYPDPHYEKTRQRIEYNPAEAHDYSVDKPSLKQITPGHYIYCNNAEFERYQKELGL